MFPLIYLELNSSGAFLSGFLQTFPEHCTTDWAGLRTFFLYFHRITESQNSRGWKGPVSWVFFLISGKLMF